MGKAAREQRRGNREARRARRVVRGAAKRRDMILRFALAYQRWNEHRGGPLHESCPGCGELVIITPRVMAGQSSGEFDASHAAPACIEFLTVVRELGGGYNYRETQRQAS